MLSRQRTYIPVTYQTKTYESQEVKNNETATKSYLSHSYFIFLHPLVPVLKYVAWCVPHNATKKTHCYKCNMLTYGTNKFKETAIHQPYLREKLVINVTMIHLYCHVNNTYGAVIQTAIHWTNVSYIYIVNTNVTTYFPKIHTMSQTYTLQIEKMYHTCGTWFHKETRYIWNDGMCL